jgi:hypothetical protein
LLKTQQHTESKALFEAITKLFESSNLPSAFYLHRELLSSKWDGVSDLSEFIATLQTTESHLASMKFSVDPKVMAFTLLNALPETPEWSIFMSSIINMIDPDKLTFDTVEVRVVSEHACLYLTGVSESVLKAKLAQQGNNKWCKHHQVSRHKMKECFSYERWVTNL